MSDNPAPAASLGERIQALYDRAKREGRKVNDYRVAREIEERYGDVGLSRAYMHQLRSGERDNPTKKVLEALAAYFEVSVAYFLEDAAAGHIAEQLDTLHRLKNSHLMDLAGRLSSLSPSSRQTVTALIDQFSAMEAAKNPPEE